MTLYTNETVDGAIQDALKQLQLDQSQVEVTVLTEPRRGFFGIGARQARVEITPLATTTTLQCQWRLNPNPPQKKGGS